MDLGTMLYNNLKDVTWSSTSLPLDQLVSSYRLPQIVKLDKGQVVEGLRDDDYLLIHSCRQWTTITAHSLEEGHYVIGPKIEIPVHYRGQFRLLEQDRDVKEPVQYFSSVEEVAKAFPERVYVMEDISFNVKMASGECNEDGEVYDVTLSAGDELTLMGQAEILYAKASKERSRLNAIFRKIGKLHSIGKLCRGKMPCLICMNHRTNESVSLPFQCKGRFSTCSPTELQMQDGEHTIRHIVEKTRLPVSVAVAGSPPRNPHDLHLIREGHRYKLVNVQTRTVVLCCVLRSGRVAPVHFPFQAATARCVLPRELLRGELWLDTVVLRWVSFCQEQLDMEDYSRAVRDVRADWADEGRSPRKCGANGRCGGGSSDGGPPAGAGDEPARSFHRLSVCVYGGNLHGNSEVDLQGCVSSAGEWALLPSDSNPPEAGEEERRRPESSGPRPAPGGPDVPYEELWLDRLRGRSRTPSGSEAAGAGAPPGSGPDGSLTPPPVPPKSEAVKEECRLLNAPPIPPRSSKQMPPPLLPVPPKDARSPSPTLSYYSSGLHIAGACEPEGADPQDRSCYPPCASWAPSGGAEPEAALLGGSLPSDALASRLSWPNHLAGGEALSADEFRPAGGRSYYSYPRKRPPGGPRACTSSLLRAADPRESDLPASLNPFGTKSSSYNSEMCRDEPVEESGPRQSLSCPILPPRTAKSPREGRRDPEEPGPGPGAAAWRPPSSLAGLSIEEVSRSLSFIGLPPEVASLFASEKIDGNLLLQLSEEILSEDFRLSRLQVTKLLQFIHGWRPKV